MTIKKTHMRIVSFLSLFMVLMGGCLDESAENVSSDPPPKTLLVPDVQNTKLFYSTIVPSQSPWKSSIWSYDLKEGSTQLLLSGESGDPLFVQTGQKMWLFNRTLESKNARTLSTYQPDTKLFDLTPGPQVALPESGYGDPHDALELESADGLKALLLAQYTEGALTLWDPSSKKVLQKLTDIWDTGTSPFKPEAFVTFRHKGQPIIGVVHQGITVQAGAVYPNGTQKLFLMTYSGTPKLSLTPIDLDPVKEKVQGIPLKGSLPLPIRPEGLIDSKEPLLFVSLCSEWVRSSEAFGAPKCQSSIESIHPETLEPSVLMDLTQEPYAMNGGALRGVEEGTFYTQVTHLEKPTTEARHMLIKIDTKNKQIRPIYVYEKTSPGFWTFALDRKSGLLFVGDQNPDMTGQFVVFEKDALLKKIPLPETPYSSALWSDPSSRP